MPLPKPGPGQDKKPFIKSFMSDEAMIKEYPDEAQRYAIAVSVWERKHK